MNNDHPPTIQADSDHSDMQEQLMGQQAIYQSRPTEVSVVFADQSQSTETLEGSVLCQPSDAIVTGAAGERWPVPASKFAEKYAPSGGQAPGQPGQYEKLPTEIRALRLTGAMDITLSDGRGVLHGEAGDWCVRYGPEDMAIVRHDIFCASYELRSIPVYVGVANGFSPSEKVAIRRALSEVQGLLKNTPLVCVDDSGSGELSTPLWFRVVRNTPVAGDVITQVLEVPMVDLLAPGKNRLVSHLLKAGNESTSTFTLEKLVQPLKALFGGGAKETDGGSEIVAAQLAAIERFNSDLANEDIKPMDGYYIQRCDSIEAAGLARTYHIGAVADDRASKHQRDWQQLVLAETSKIAKVGNCAESCGRLAGILGFLKLLLRPTLISFGLMAAFGLASFSELSGGCSPDDPFAWLGCATETWKRGYAPISFFGIYMLALIIAWFKYARAKTEKWEARHQDLRLLAECLRVSYVRAVLHQSNCVADDLPLVQHSESGWVRLALYSIDHAQGFAKPEKFDGQEGVTWVQANFIDDQVKYHNRTLIERRKSAITFLSSAGRWGFMVFICALIVLAANVMSEFAFHQGFLGMMGHHFVLIAQVAGLAFWGSMRKVLDSYGLEQELQRGELVLNQLLQARRLSVEGGEVTRILEAARFFVLDQMAWHALHRSKPIEAATGA